VAHWQIANEISYRYGALPTDAVAVLSATLFTGDFPGEIAFLGAGLVRDDVTEQAAF
jgi:hypothetical protein